MGIFNLFSGKNKDAIKFCEILSNLNKLMIEFKTNSYDGRINKNLYNEIKLHFEFLNQSILNSSEERIVKLMETPITRYTDGEVQVAFISESNYTLGSTWFRSRMDFERIEQMVKG